MYTQWLPLLIFGSYFIPKSAGIRCYTCGQNDDDTISCSDFQISDPRFNSECETNSRSCRLSRKVNENVILSRSCENIKLDDCKIANSIEFCYCTTDLCNKINPSDDEEDEEPLEEGSGTGLFDMDSTTEAKKSNQDITLSTGKSNVNLHIEKTVGSSCSLLCHSLWCFLSTVCVYIYSQY